MRLTFYHELSPSVHSNKEMKRRRECIYNEIETVHTSTFSVISSLFYCQLSLWPYIFHRNTWYFDDELVL
jgi:hypothetical protein